MTLNNFGLRYDKHYESRVPFHQRLKFGYLSSVDGSDEESNSADLGPYDSENKNLFFLLAFLQRDYGFGIKRKDIL